MFGKWLKKKQDVLSQKSIAKYFNFFFSEIVPLSEDSGHVSSCLGWKERQENLGDNMIEGKRIHW